MLATRVRSSLSLLILKVCEVNDGVALRANRRIVRRDHDAHPVLAQRAERGGDVASRGLIKLRGRFIHEEKSGGACESAREEHTLSLAARQIPKRALREMRQVEGIKEPVRLDIGLCPAHAAGQQGQHDVVNRAAGADAERVLEDPRNAGTLCANRTRDGDRSLGWSVPSRDQRQQG